MTKHRRHKCYSKQARDRARLRAIFQPHSPENLLAEIEAVMTEVEMLHQGSDATVKAIRRLETQLCRRAG